MTAYESEHLPVRKRKSSAAQFRPIVWFTLPLAAILFQVYVPRFFPFLAYLELPLLVTVFLALMRRRPATGALAGAAIGIAQDSLSTHPLGMFGIAKTLAGYLSASLSTRFDADNVLLRFLLTFGLYLLHQVVFWAMSRGLLGQSPPLEALEWVIFGFLNAVVAVPLFLVLDRLKVDAS
jgi:rod shape-determining protein MreD